MAHYKQWALDNANESKSRAYTDTGVKLSAYGVYFRHVGGALVFLDKCDEEGLRCRCGNTHYRPVGY